MKNTIFLIAISLFTFHLSAQNTNPKYDAELAKKVGADDYGMKSYIFVILKTGTNTSTDKTEVAKAFNGHMANMDKMVEDGKLIVAGPIGDNDKNYRGIFILNETDMEKAKALLATDPAIKAKFLDYDLFPWYGSAALSEYLKASDKVWKVGM
ncbi:uncharacterized protein YciI [Winogradskyella wandonensis]|uniref:Uncharacterized protein YciI n=1 Tax=Winogradskyella wandonensis TaxID=1442586 RepID=A0A4R1KPA9_9FLAO|nr:YciI family protein [Winogradskyella wandonensis]TCK66832.1 uncharacterized protein YciI [Winogradskyella wandonensis]